MFCDVIKVSHSKSTLRVLYNKKAPRARSAVKIMEVVLLKISGFPLIREILIKD